MLTSINPSTGAVIAAYETLDNEGIESTIAAVKKTGQDWSQRTFQERASILKRVAHQLRADKAILSQYMTDEMGKPVKEAGPEVEKSAWCLEHYAEHAEAYLAPDVLMSDATESFVQYQPLGVLLGVLPWNAPLWIAFRYLAPALMAGNTCLMKHDPHVQGCAQAIVDAFDRSGAPSHLVSNLPIGNDQVAQVIQHRDVQAVSFTGSARAGGIVAATAAAEIKHSVLELGGSDAFIVLANADLEKAADTAVLSRMINAGQSCIAAKRILVEEPVYDAFLTLVHARLARWVMGDPSDVTTDFGPLAREDLRDNLHRQVRTSIDQGAKCLLGGDIPSRAGYFYPATLLVDVTPDMTVFREEVFGPVMVVSKVDSAEQAVDYANRSEYGLGAGIWSQDIEHARQLAMNIEAGQVAINGIVKTDPRLPSGGIKKSGYGRELGPHGIREFVNAKQIWIG